MKRSTQTKLLMHISFDVRRLQFWLENKTEDNFENVRVLHSMKKLFLYFPLLNSSSIKTMLKSSDDEAVARASEASSPRT